VPATQVTHAVADTLAMIGLDVPEEQTAQDVREAPPVVVLYVPVGQAVQEAPLVPLNPARAYRPALQVPPHAAVAAPAAPHVPAGQFKQDV
jgi:hypothetical protein